ncbi:MULTISPECIES: hypothetical protein [Sphingobacterium]|uniref:hypothetical protein n=1 Tax=Sphingobacterium TaxID=28453 RepID=UPI00257E2570|nr:MULTISPECIES: hypothetical protein [Sphingobacterium]
MTSINRKVITENILKLIDSNGIEDNDFAHLIEKSTRTLSRIRKGQSLFNIDAINVASSFFDKSLIELNKQNIVIEADSRSTLKRIHKNNVAYSSLLEKRPSITYAITYHLLNNKEFCSTGMIVDKIKKLFESLGWNYSSSYISSSMRRNSKYIAVAGTMMVDGNEVNVYKSK